MAGAAQHHKLIYVLTPYAKMHSDATFPPELRRQRLHKLRKQMLWPTALAGCIFPPWLLAFTAIEQGGFRFMWPFLLWESIVPEPCLRLADNAQNEYELKDARCHDTYHNFASVSVVQASILLCVANLCVLFLCQLGGWRGSDTMQCTSSSFWHGKESLLAILVSVVFILPVLPISVSTSQIVVSANATWHTELLTKTRRDWVTMGLSACFFGVAPLLCGLRVLLLARKQALDIINELHSATEDRKGQATGPRMVDPLVSEQDDRFVGDAKDIIVGKPETAATGIWRYILADEHAVHEQLSRGVACVKDEWERGFQAGCVTSEDLNNLNYILEQCAGSSDMHFQNGWQRDRDPLTGELLQERTRHDGTGMKLEDFVASRSAQRAGLDVTHVLALRLYTTSAFRSINNPLRKLEHRSDASTPRLDRPHPLPCTVFLISDGLKKLRVATRDSRGETAVEEPYSNSDPLDLVSGVGDATPSRSCQTRDFAVSEVGAPIFPGVHERSDVSPDAEAAATLVKTFVTMSHLEVEVESPQAVSRRRTTAVPAFASLPSPVSSWISSVRPSPLRGSHAHHEVVLWRGMKNMRATEDFLRDGGSELAPCSTSADLKMAIRYAKDWQADGNGRGDTALIFRVLIDDFMSQGPDLSFLSVFPHEKEALYPPLTFFKPVSREVNRLAYNGTEFSIVDVKPSFPT